MRQEYRWLLSAIVALVCGIALSFTGQPLALAAEERGDGVESYRFVGPYTHQNLSIYLIRGDDRLEASDILTLDEALKQRKVVVHETGQVNELAIENVSETERVFVHAGDIVKGGRQDRVLSYDLLLQPQSGKVPIASFCAEQGRWQARGAEEASTFASSENRLNSKALKLAAQSARAQGTVWEEVARVQDKLAETVGTTVRAPASATSLQLSLEGEEVVRSIEGYRTALAGIIDTSGDVIGFAFAINGQLNSVELYGARDLFVKLWPKLLESTASEALAEQTSGTTAPSTFSKDEVKAFMREAADAPVKDTKVADITEVEYRESDQALYIESRSRKKESNWVHRGYVKK